MDRHTLFATQATLLIFLGIGVLLSHRAYRWKTADKSAAWFAAGYLLGGAGLLLQSWRGMISPWLSVVAGNFLFLLLMPCMNRSIGEATKQKTKPTLYAMLALAVLTVVNFAYYTFVKPDLLLRNVEACVVMMIMVALNFTILVRSKDEVIRPAIRLLTILMSAHFVATGLRIVTLLRRGSEWFNMGGQVTIVGLAITFMWIDALRLRNELEQRAMIDPLTSLFNRRALDLMAARELQRTTRNRQPCSALMIDIDFFKEINDGMGHSAGDSTLCAVAGALRGSLRGTDIATRLGGDEFFLLLPDADEAAVNVVVARIRNAIDLLRLQTIGGQQFTVAVSIGQVTLRGPEVTLQELLHESDVMLYQEKQASRSQPDMKTPVRQSGGAQVQPSRA
jgi:diguanylate cyclase (GGDEF)-like protein